METTNSESFKRNGKFLLVLPLLVLPFLTMAFWSLGGGKSTDRGQIITDTSEGLKTELPEAKFNADEKQDKFSIYEQSLMELHKASFGADNSGSLHDELSGGAASDQEAEIARKLEMINSEINRQPEPSYSSSAGYRPVSGSSGSDVARLEQLLGSLQNGSSEDQEMRQLNTILEKIMDIQNPSRRKDQLKSLSEKNSKQVYAVSMVNTSPLTGQPVSTYLPDPKGNAINAVIHQDQEIISGSVVKLRLMDSIYVNGSLIPRNEFVYGIASLEGERLKIDIATLRYKNSILPVALSAYDLDGLEGLYIPGAITRDAIKSGTEDAIQSLQLMTMDPSVSTQVASAGITAAKGLFSKKAKQIKVKVKAGYKLLLRDNNVKPNN